MCGLLGLWSLVCSNLCLCLVCGLLVLVWHQAEEAARALAQEGWEAVFAKVDAKSRENKGLLERYGTSGPLPQVLIFQGRSVLHCSSRVSAVLLL